MPFSESIAVAAIGWIASPVIRKLGSECFSYVGMDVPKELRELETDVLPKILLAMKGTVNGSDMPELEPWLQRLKIAYYKAEDVLDEARYQKEKTRVHPKNRTFMVRVTSYPVVKPLEKFFSGKVSNKVACFSRPKRKLWRDLTNLKEDVRGLVKDARTFRELLRNVPQTDVTGNASECNVQDTSLLINDLVVGREEDCRNIIRLLMKPNTTLCHEKQVVAIVGRGGSGKTTLAKCVYNDERVVRYFYMRIWVCLTRKLNILEHTKQMIESATQKDSPKLSNLDTLQRTLSKVLAESEKTLVVLDDVWYENRKKPALAEEWDKLMSPFVSLRNCSVLVTSQSSNLPAALHTQNLINLSDLKAGHLVSIFRHYSRLEEVRDSHLKGDLQEIGDQIVAKMSHSPLAAKAVASHLRTKLDVDIWRNTLERDNLSETTDALVWSFQQLEEPVQRCFLYCSVFPKSFQFTKLMMVEMWVALNFIKCSDATRGKVLALGNEYFDTLVDILFFQQTLRRTPLEPFYSMHDSFHDLAERLSKYECFRIEDENVIDIPSTVCHLSINVSTINQQLERNIRQLVNLRTLIVLPALEDCSIAVLERILAKLKKLRVLQLILYGAKELPKTVFDLRYLKLLNIEHTSIEQLPISLSKLYLLQSLATSIYRSKRDFGLGWVVSPMATRLITEAFDHVLMEVPEELVKLETHIPPRFSLASSAALNPWLQCLKDAYYEAEDVLDEASYLKVKKPVHIKSSLRVKRLLITCRAVLERLTNFSGDVGMKPSLRFSQETRMLRTLLRNLEDNVRKLVEDADMFNQSLRNPLPNNAVILDVPAIPVSSSKVTKVFGRDQDRSHLIRLLLQEQMGESSKQSYSIVAVVGRSGAGKTTLVQDVYDNETIVRYFGMRIWICLKHKLDVVEHTKEMIWCVGKQVSPEESDLDLLQFNLRKILLGSKRRILLVLDGVWYDKEAHEDKQWEQLMAPFATISKCNVLLTSRSQDLPVVFHTENLIKLRDLKLDDLVSLFRYHSHLEDIVHTCLGADLMDIGDRIVAKMSSSPLAVKVVASQLRTRLEINAWRDVLESADISETTDALLWFFEHLMAPTQRCLLDCSVFPKGFEFSEKMLVERWRALNLIGFANRQTEDIRNGYFSHFSKLVDSFFFQPSTKWKFHYTIHDSFHDLAERLASDECYRIESHKIIEIPSTVRHLGIDARSIKQYAPNISKLENLRSIITMERLEKDSFAALRDILGKLGKLRVLQLKLSDDITELPDTVLHLKYLKMLCIGQTAIIPTLEQLSKFYLMQVLVVPDSLGSINLTNTQNIRRYLPSIQVLRVEDGQATCSDQDENELDYDLQDGR